MDDERAELMIRHRCARPEVRPRLEFIVCGGGGDDDDDLQSSSVTGNYMHPRLTNEDEPTCVCNKSAFLFSFFLLPLAGRGINHI